MVDWWFGGLGFKSGYPLSMFNAGIPGIQTTRPQTTNLGRYQKLEERKQMLKTSNHLDRKALHSETWQPEALEPSFRFFWGKDFLKKPVAKIQISNDQNLPPPKKNTQNRCFFQPEVQVLEKMAMAVRLISAFGRVPASKTMASAAHHSEIIRKLGSAKRKN